MTESEDVDAELQVTLGWLRLPQRRSTALLRLATLLTVGFTIADLAARHLRFDVPAIGDVWQPGVDSIAKSLTSFGPYSPLR